MLRLLLSSGCERTSGWRRCASTVPRVFDAANASKTLARRRSPVKRYRRKRPLPKEHTRAEIHGKHREHACYLLAWGRKSYIGYTVNPEKRLRQHNAEIGGGAKATASCATTPSGARFVVIVHGFADEREALKFEWAWKLRRPRGRNTVGRAKRLCEIMALEQWTARSRPTREQPPLKVAWFVPLSSLPFDPKKDFDYKLPVTHTEADLPCVMQTMYPQGFVT